MRKISHQKGTTLIEIMVAIVVMAIGLLGLASLQLNALKYQKTASQRSEAVQAAYDLGERMRANWLISSDPSKYSQDRADNEARYKYDAYYSTTIALDRSALPNNCAILMSNSAGCDAKKIADNDKMAWLRMLELRLAGGAGLILPVTTGTSVSSFDITVMWKEQGLTSTDPACPGNAAAPVGVRCFTLRYTI
ncbi:type IV pilus modification protein PilV [Undibacterium sp. LX40W]|uniref:Type IV pilus modification protein PilV n=1 Tax=Undibacterium nitidum TaxID=2762298 RepID=A0A923HSK6_9BURK|nr:MULTISPECIES: type IV pilus modification protein PilV [Undibacterium]MBC3882545.1 type IV pilus modification protein PilV [Undibacterium nitidum]MBC3892826.1 type IV pilus modification protein PilV [Undibacterium sp. LX40W]